MNIFQYPDHSSHAIITRTVVIIQDMPHHQGAIKEVGRVLIVDNQ